MRKKAPLAVLLALAALPLAAGAQDTTVDVALFVGLPEGLELRDRTYLEQLAAEIEARLQPAGVQRIAPSLMPLGRADFFARHHVKYYIDAALDLCASGAAVTMRMRQLPADAAAVAVEVTVIDSYSIVLAGEVLQDDTAKLARDLELHFLPILENRLLGTGRQLVLAYCIYGDQTDAATESLRQDLTVHYHRHLRDELTDPRFQVRGIARLEFAAACASHAPLRLTSPDEYIVYGCLGRGGREIDLYCELQGRQVSPALIVQVPDSLRENEDAIALRIARKVLEFLPAGP